MKGQTFTNTKPLSELAKSKLEIVKLKKENSLLKMQLSIHGVLGSADFDGYTKIEGKHEKYTCPNCEMAPDIVDLDTKESRCFKDKIIWGY